MIGRALLRRCPNCGNKGIFTGWFKMRDRCPTCSHVYSREQGYWVMAIVINTAIAEGIFGILFIAGLIITAPDFAWAPLLTIAIVTNTIGPLFFYPISKTLWVAVDLFMHPARGPAS
jgi:uncharacterized protein (DUF983 family)